MFTPDNVIDRLKQQPFRPFRIVTSSGETYNVQHPDLLVGANELAVGSASKKNPRLYDRLHRIALMHVTALEDLSAASGKSKRNGRGK